MSRRPLSRGDVVITRFPFTDLSGAKPRPALVIGADSSGSDCIVAYISKVVPSRAGPCDFVVHPRDPEFALTGLRFPSVFRMDKIATVSRTLMTSRLGRVGPGIRREIDGRLRRALDLR